MTIYIYTIAAVFFYGFICFHKCVNEKNKKIFLSLIFVHMGIIMAMRGIRVGNDTRAYYMYFLKWGEAGKQVGGATQPVYYWYNQFIYFFTHNAQTVIVFNSIIEVAGVAWFIYFFSDNVFLSSYLWITLYFFCESMNIARQFLALSIVMAAFVLMWKKDRTKEALVLFLLAIGTHSLVITLIPVFAIKFINLTRKKIYLLAGCGTLFILMFDTIFSFAINMFCSMFPYYKQYLKVGVFNVYNKGGSRNVLLIIFYLIFVIAGLFMVRRKELSETKKRDIMVLLVPCIITVAIGLGAVNIVSVQRVKVLYSTFFICLIPNIISCFNRKDRKIIGIVVMIITIIPFAVQLSENYGGVVPYRFFWQ